jgi:hypothetical protein
MGSLHRLPIGFGKKGQFEGPPLFGKKGQFEGVAPQKYPAHILK